jgi:hypothetical protein
MMEQGVDEIGLILRAVHFAEGDERAGSEEVKQTRDGGCWFEGGTSRQHTDLRILTAVWHMRRSGW